MSENVDFGAWQSALRVDGILRSASLAADVAEMNEHVLGSEDWHTWRPIVSRAVSITAEQALAEDEAAHEGFVAACERRGMTLEPAGVQSVMREVADALSRRCSLALDAILGDLSGIEELLDEELARRSGAAPSLSERAATIERRLRDGCDLWWPDSNTLVASYWQHPSPSVEVFKTIGDEPLLAALPAAIREAEIFGDEHVRIFDLVNHLEGGHVGAATTAEALRSVALDLATLTGPVVSDTLGTLEECREAVEARDLAHLPCLGGDRMGDPVRGWYEARFPDDPCAASIAPGLTFGEALDAVPLGSAFYDVLGAGDSLVRERVFEELSKRSGLAYDELYESWLNRAPLPSRDAPPLSEARDAPITSPSPSAAEAHDGKEPTMPDDGTMASGVGATGPVPTEIANFSYTTSYGDAYTMALYRDRYLSGGSLALGAVVVAGPDEEEALEDWGALSVNVPDDPDARAWCETEGNLVIDTNNQSRELVAALVDAGHVTLSGGTCRSGFCTYPLASVSPETLASLGTYEETVCALEERASGNPSLSETLGRLGRDAVASRDDPTMTRGEDDAR